MTSDNQPEEILEGEIETPTVDGDFGAFLSGDTEPDEAISEAEARVPATSLEQTLAKVDKKAEIEAKKPEDAKFKFRNLLDEKQRKDLVAGAPKLAVKFTNDVNEIISFGGTTVEKSKAISRQFLEAQKKIEIPEADIIINDFLRELDGFEKKYRNVNMEKLQKKFLGLFKGTKYNMKTMVRDMKPVEDKIDLAEIKFEEMDQTLEDNISRGQLLHAETIKQMNQVVMVLAALEEIIENIRRDYKEVDGILTDASTKGLNQVEYQGKLISVNELQEKHANLSLALSESEKSWYDWRQMFFLGWANAPATRNLVVTTVALRRRLKTFKDMGLEAGRRALITAKNAAEARSGAEMGNAAQAAVNGLIQRTYGDLADTTKLIAEASQAPIITEETVTAIVESVKNQARSIVEADRNGRALRARNVQALERGEVQIEDEVLTMQTQLAENARRDPGISGNQLESKGSQRAIDGGDDLLSTLGG